MTSSDDEKDILAAYNLYVNCYVTKPVDLDQFIGVVKSIEHFWFTIVKLPAAWPSREAHGRTAVGFVRADFSRTGRSSRLISDRFAIL